jgi:hypothetical protein
VAAPRTCDVPELHRSVRGADSEVVALGGPAQGGDVGLAGGWQWLGGSVSGGVAVAVAVVGWQWQWLGGSDWVAVGSGRVAVGSG